MSYQEALRKKKKTHMMQEYINEDKKHKMAENLTFIQVSE